MASRRRADVNPKLHMDRQPTAARITDPSVAAGKRREIDNVMKKARANTNDYWDKKLIEVEEKDPNRWRHTGYKKMYIQGESSSGESDVHGMGGGGGNLDRERYNRYKSSVGGPGAGVGGVGVGMGMGMVSPALSMEGNIGRGRPRSPPPPRGGGGGGGVGGGGVGMGMPSRYNAGPPPNRYRSRSPPPMHHGIDRRGGMSPPSSMDGGIRGRPRTPNEMGRRPMGRPRSPPEPAMPSGMRRKSSRSPPPPLGGGRRRTPPPPEKRAGHILPRSKRPPSPPPRRSRSNSSVSSSSDDSCSLCSPSHRHRSRSGSVRQGRAHGGGPRSPPPKQRSQYRGPLPPPDAHGARMHGRPASPPLPPGRGASNAGVVDKYRGDPKMRRLTRERSMGGVSSDGHAKASRSGRHSPPEDPRLKNRPPEPPEPATSTSGSAAAPAKKKKKEKELRTRIKIEGEKRSKKHSSSESDDSGGSDSDEASLPSFSATTRLTLSERFGKMAQWSVDRSNMENMRITKDSAGGALKVMLEEGLESPPRRYEYSPAPAGHFPEELATTAPSGMLSWDDVRVRYEYYKSRGYLRDLDLKDYIKWEEWWYKYQEWLKQERYFEYWDRQQMRRRRKKLPVAQRLN